MLIVSNAVCECVSPRVVFKADGLQSTGTMTRHGVIQISWILLAAMAIGKRCPSWSGRLGNMCRNAKVCGLAISPSITLARSRI